MAVYKATFTPSGPYFFGNEKNFSYNGGSKYGNLYLIRGEAMPSQSTLLGALRYIFLPHKGFAGLSNDMKAANRDAVGGESFSLDAAEKQEFGQIKAISAVFLAKGDTHFIPTPFDHKITREQEKGKVYTPFDAYKPLDAEADTLYTECYDAKEGIANSFMSLDDGHLEDELFGSDVRIGIDRKNTKDGFFKREYRTLRSGFSFAVYVRLELEPDLAAPYTVLLGQGKVPFSVRFAETGEQDVRAINRQTEEFLRRVRRPHRTLLCLSDMLIGSGDVYANTRFAVVQTRDYRSYITGDGGMISKGSVLHRLVKAGSVFLLKSDADDLFKEETRHQNAKTAGYNQFVILEANTND